MHEKSITKTKKTICHMCQNFCGITAHVKNGRLAKITGMAEHPANKICMKAHALSDIVYSPERILNPLRQKNGRWQQISWDEAFHLIENKLTDIKEKYGAKTLLSHLGYPPVGFHALEVARRFNHLFGTPNYTSGASLCFGARLIGHSLTDALTLLPSYENTRCIVLWGYNPQNSRVREASFVLSAKKKGAKLIVVDPRTTWLAKKADLHIKIKPGTDAALALGLLNVIISEGLYDRSFVKDWTIGFDELNRHLHHYHPEIIERMTWVPAKTTRQFAEMYAGNKPATIAQGVSLDHCINGVQISRAIAALIAITGNLDKTGGSVCSFPARLQTLGVKKAFSYHEAIGAAYPIFRIFVGETTATPTPDAIMTGKPYPLKALFFDACNPLLTWPNTNKVKDALSKVDLLVVSDLFMTETAKRADVVLPAAHFLEQEMLHDHVYEGFPLLALGRQVLEPPIDCREDWRIWSDLGRGMGYTEYFPWQNTDELFSSLLEPSGISVEQLKENPGGIYYQHIELEEKYREKGFHTPSAKVELFSQRLADHGYPPLITYEEADKAEGYPYILITGCRGRSFVHSQHRNIPRLRKRHPYPRVELNALTAKDLGITENEQIIVESPRGSICLKARLTHDIHPKVLSMQHGWMEANCNILTDDEARDPISGFPGFKTVQCRVLKL